MGTLGDDSMLAMEAKQYSCAERLASLLERISRADQRLLQLEKKADDGVERVKRDLFNRGIYSAIFITVPDDYYDR
jgi:hypothetical protein